MRRFLFAAAVLSFAVAARADDAASLFAKRCATCHGKDGKGSAMGQRLGVSDLTAVKGSEAEIEGVIANGKGKMTAYKGKLSDAEIKALAAYVKKGLE